MTFIISHTPVHVMSTLCGKLHKTWDTQRQGWQKCLSVFGTSWGLWHSQDTPSKLKTFIQNSSDYISRLQTYNSHSSTHSKALEESWKIQVPFLCMKVVVKGFSRSKKHYKKSNKIEVSDVSWFVGCTIHYIIWYISITLIIY